MDRRAVHSARRCYLAHVNSGQSQWRRVRSENVLSEPLVTLLPLGVRIPTRYCSYCSSFVIIVIPDSCTSYPRVRCNVVCVGFIWPLQNVVIAFINLCTLWRILIWIQQIWSSELDEMYSYADPTPFHTHIHTYARATRAHIRIHNTATATAAATATHNHLQVCSPHSPCGAYLSRYCWNHCIVTYATAMSLWGREGGTAPQMCVSAPKGYPCARGPLTLVPSS